MKTEKTDKKSEKKDKFEELIQEIAEKQGSTEIPDLSFLDLFEDPEEKPIPFPYGGGKGFGKWVTGTNRHNPDFAAS